MTQQSLKIFVYYFVQNDSFDGLVEPNIYALPGNYTNINQVKAGDVYSSFPLKFENCYLRFYLDDKSQNMKVWMDYHPEMTIPVYNDKTYVKVLRLPKNVKLNFKNNEYYTKPVKEIMQKENPNGNKSEKLIDMNDDSGSNSSNSNPGSKFNSTGGIKTNTNSQIHNNNNNGVNNGLINSNISFSKSPERVTESRYDSSNGNKNQAKSNNNMILINMEETNNNHSNNKSSNISSNGNLKNSVNVDNIDFTAIENNLKENNSESPFSFINEESSKKKNSENILIDVTGDSNQVPLGQTKSSPDVSKKNDFNPMSELNNMNWTDSSNDTTTKQKSTNNVIPSFTTTIKSNYPIDNIPSNLDEDTMREKVDEIVKKWSFGVNEKKNLRFILGSFQEIWTGDPMWKEVSMQSLVEKQDVVKTLYKKALGQTHPDKNKGSDAKTQYLADSLYNILTEAKIQLPK